MNTNKNEDLIKKYPFLKITCYEPEYEFTWLDDLEPGWRIAFGDDLCRELADAIKKDNCEDSFGFDQIKEKFAQLRLYAHGYGNKTRKVLTKYEDLSMYMCGHCGKPARYISKGWYYPFCEDCIKLINSDYKNIEDFYNFKSYNEVLEEIDKIKNL